MNSRNQWTLRIGLLFILFIFGPPLLFADDCSAYSDCFGNLGAAAGAAAAAGALAAGLAAGGVRGIGRNANAGFVFMAGKKGSFGDLRAGPSANSSVVGRAPFGVRLLYRGTATDGQGNLWYHVHTGGGGAWVSSGDVSIHNPSGGPDSIINTGPAARSDGPYGSTGARG